MPANHPASASRAGRSNLINSPQHIIAWSRYWPPGGLASMRGQTPARPYSESHGDKTLDQPDCARRRHDHRQDLRQARQASGPRPPPKRREEHGDEGELTQLDADVEADPGA